MGHGSSLSCKSEDDQVIQHEDVVSGKDAEEVALDRASGAAESDITHGIVESLPDDESTSVFCCRSNKGIVTYYEDATAKQLHSEKYQRLSEDKSCSEEDGSEEFSTVTSVNDEPTVVSSVVRGPADAAISVQQESASPLGSNANPAAPAIVNKDRAIINSQNSASILDSAVDSVSSKGRTSETPLTTLATGRYPVEVDSEYDHWDAVRRERMTRNVGEIYVHERPKRPSFCRSASGSSSFLRQETVESLDSVSDSACGLSQASLESPQSDNETSLEFDPDKVQAQIRQELVTRWGVLAAKVLWTRSTEDPGRVKRQKRRSKAVHLKSESESASKIRLANKSTTPNMGERRATDVLKKMQVLIRQVKAATTDKQDSDCVKDDMMTFLFGSDYVDTIFILAKAAQRILAAQPTVVEASPPCKVFGDIHGQLRDLNLILGIYGLPSADNDRSFVFNGDFVDRGSHQLEVIGVLFALKIVMPDKVWLIRGNHEERSMNERYGFRDACTEKLGDELGPKAYDTMQNAFDQLPLACTIAESILCVHGGIGKGKWSLEDLRQVKRPLTGDDLYASHNKWLFNVLWSDPIEDDDDDVEGTFGVHSSSRAGAAVQFGWDVTKTFCARNGLGMVIRSHQCKDNGNGFDVMHERQLIRVFSARDYEDHNNDSAVLSIKFDQHEAGYQYLKIRAQVLRSLLRPRGRGRNSVRLAQQAQTQRELE
eukprot:TRINITY_DN26829_c0_g1_i1.p1 TRINITY_DN26829_c0_g1~~TRINITY_DN26829_c0_g1_i1.p1  ORF type:complete len:723 (-),score=98.93 TRINITY_DN26829_c0_g1_i1:305-2443(-)